MLCPDKEQDLWFIQAGNVTHYCTGVLTKTGDTKEIVGDLKPADTITDISAWFYPANLKEGETYVYVCSVCKAEKNVADIEVLDNA